MTKQSQSKSESKSQSQSHKPSKRAGNERAHAGRVRRPALIAVAVEIALYATLPSALIVGPRLILPVLGVLLLVPLALGTRTSEPSRGISVQRGIAITLILLIGVVNTVSLALLIEKIVSGDALDGAGLLIAAVQVWATNVITFALIYWELDRGGPLSRARLPREKLRPADFRFPQDEDHDAVREVAAHASATSDWRPAFVDYLYVSTTNSSAFSPTDTMPLTGRVKVLMGIEASEALALSLLVVAQAVSLISA
jgi:cellulase/cellobiase CelA1